MIEPEALRTAIATALNGQIGTYIFKSTGDAIPALRVDDGSDPYEEEPAVEGLEVIIQPSLDVTVNLVFEGYKQTFGTLIVLKQWDITQTTLQPLAGILEAIAQFQELSVGQVRRQIRLSRLDNIETLFVPVTQTVLTEV